MSDVFFRPTGKFWTDTLPIWGCLRPCKLSFSVNLMQRGVCYAELVAVRAGQSVEFHARNVVNEAGVRKLIAARKPRIVFNSMTEPAGWDEKTQTAFLNLVGPTRHEYLLCTKQPGVAYRNADSASAWQYPTIWLGFTATTQREYDERVAQMPDTPRNWVILEPLREPIDLHLDRVKPSWVVVGLETGRRIPVEGWWTRAIGSIIEQCYHARVPLWTKAMPELSVKAVNDLLPIRRMPEPLARVWGRR